ncbi:monooxygenase family protein [Labedella endophytica]|uniref:DUF4188 domain-containing protein n=1 Tax=Labedella endophytica TaxID=1523160 RepID=A0A3S1CPY8_9MICO|nr:DUF4188 domain-containing protein [Labedella endophytica]RUQ98165.1 DUF4188 domain-containing protein [Labedella endophytica]
MHNVIRGRMTHEYDGELVVFRMGLRVNRWRRPDLWLPPYRAMTRMLRELQADPDSGLLGAATHVDRNGPSQTQYWSSLDELYAYAADASASHRAAWNIFSRTTRRSGGAVGVWHETFLVDRAESLYVTTPVMGLARATSIVSAGHGEGGGGERIGADETRAPASAASSSPDAEAVR